MKNRILSIFLAAAMILGMMPAISLPALADTPAYAESGSGTLADPYVIKTMAQLEALADTVSTNEMTVYG